MMKWLIVFLCFQLMLMVSHLFLIFETFEQASDVLFTINAFQIFSALGMIGLLCSPFFFPGILYGLPRIPPNFLKKRNTVA